MSDTKPMPEKTSAEGLSDEYIASVVRDARRYQGQWTGTAGTLAAHCMRLVRERERMLEANRSSGVAEAAASAAEIAAAWEKYRKPFQNGPLERRVYGADGDGPLNVLVTPVGERPATVAVTPEGFAPSREQTPAEELCERTAAVIRDRRPRYGGPKHHFARTVGMVNAAFADVLKRPLTEADWAVIMVLDKIARFRGPGSTVDGPIDIAGYAACLYEVMEKADQ